MLKKIGFQVIEFKKRGTKAELIYEYDGIKNKIKKENADKIELVELAVEKILFDYWYSFHKDETFIELGLMPPEVYDYDKDKMKRINCIGDYVGKCEDLDKNYPIVMDILRGIARGAYITTLQSVDGDEVIF